MGLITTTDYIPNYEIKKLANKLLDESDCLQLPINVEQIIRYLGLDILLLDLNNDLECFLQMNFSTIVINEKKFFDDKQQKRLRFSLAHEVGHFILHRNLLRFWNIDSIARSYNFFNNFSDEEYSLIEKQADLFASNLLVPEKLFFKEYSKLKKEFLLAKQGFFITELAKIFDVNEIVIKIKLDNFENKKG